MGSDMDEIVRIVRAIGRQQGRNAYYRVCYGLLKQLQDLVLHTSNDLLRLYCPGGSVGERDLGPVSRIAVALRNTVDEYNARARTARSRWE